jgi:hypothetical protein
MREAVHPRVELKTWKTKEENSKKYSCERLGEEYL